jgi:hypothetical protein
VTATNALGKIAADAPGITIDAIIRSWAGGRSHYATLVDPSYALSSSCAISRDGLVYAAGLQLSRTSKQVTLFSVTDAGVKTILQEIISPAGQIDDNFSGNVALSPDATFLSVASKASVYMYKRSGQAWILHSQFDHGGSTFPGYRSMEFSPDGRRFYYTFSRSQAYGIIMRLDGDKWVQELIISSSQFGSSLGTDMSFNADSSRVVVGGYGYVQVYDRVGTTWSKKYDTSSSLEYNLGTGVAMSGDGSRFAATTSRQSYGSPRYIFLYEMGTNSATWTRTLIFNAGGRPDGGGNNETFCAISNDGKNLLYSFTGSQADQTSGVLTFVGSGASIAVTNNQFFLGAGETSGGRLDLSGDGYRAVVGGRVYRAR